MIWMGGQLLQVVGVGGRRGRVLKRREKGELRKEEGGRVTNFGGGGDKLKGKLVNLEAKLLYEKCMSITHRLTHSHLSFINVFFHVHVFLFFHVAYFCQR